MWLLYVRERSVDSDIAVFAQREVADAVKAHLTQSANEHGIAIYRGFAFRVSDLRIRFIELYDESVLETH